MAGYTTITVKGQEIGLRFGLPAIKRIETKINLLAGAEEITLNMMSMVHILYAGYENECIANDKVPVIPFSDFYDLVETAALADDLSQVKRVIEVFAGSKDVKEVEGGEKKNMKSTGKKSKDSASGKTGTLAALHGENTSSSSGHMIKTG
jgi:hypothetical protein